MSSFRKNKKEVKSILKERKKILCPYCDYSLSNLSYICNNCELIQDITEYSYVKNYLLFKKNIKNYIIKDSFILSNNELDWNNFKKYSLPKIIQNNIKCSRILPGKSIHEKLKELYPKTYKSINSKYINNYLPHLILWDHISKTSNNNFALIMNEKTIFSKYFIENLNIILHDLQDAEFDILYISHNKHLNGTKITPLLVRPPSKREPIKGINDGFNCYIIRVKSIPNLINSVSSFEDETIDENIQRNFGELIDALFLAKPLVTHY
jgi:hypothetical protein